MATAAGVFAIRSSATSSATATIIATSPPIASVGIGRCLEPRSTATCTEAIPCSNSGAIGAWITIIGAT